MQRHEGSHCAANVYRGRGSPWRRPGLVPEVLDRIHGGRLSRGVARGQRGARKLVEQLLAGLQPRLDGVRAGGDLGLLRITARYSRDVSVQGTQKQQS